MSFNKTTLILHSLIFEKGSLNLLKKVGLSNIYLDDHGSRKKYRNCIFFLFKINPDFVIKSKKNGLDIMPFLDSMASFSSYHDYYETEDGWMFVFRYNTVFKPDIKAFRESKFSELSTVFKEAVCPNAEEILKESPIVNLEEEIYRYNKKESF